jgi:NAD(P)-dependent dehydrogenase (short-subunit alcohol dehydrogenase family)
MRRPQDDSNAAYGASKAALASFTRSLAFELGPYNIRANGVVPNWIWGPNVEHYFEALAKERGVDPKVVYDEVASRTALKRLTTSADVADAIVFLASDRARAISGISLDINAGEYFP